MQSVGLEGYFASYRAVKKGKEKDKGLIIRQSLCIMHKSDDAVPDTCILLLWHACPLEQIPEQYYTYIQTPEKQNGKAIKLTKVPCKNLHSLATHKVWRCQCTLASCRWRCVVSEVSIIKFSWKTYGLDIYTLLSIIVHLYHWWYNQTQLWLVKIFCLLTDIAGNCYNHIKTQLQARNQNIHKSSVFYNTAFLNSFGFNRARTQMLFMSLFNVH